MPVAGQECHSEKGQMLMLSLWFQLGGREGRDEYRERQGKGYQKGPGPHAPAAHGWTLPNYTVFLKAHRDCCQALKQCQLQTF